MMRNLAFSRCRAVLGNGQGASAEIDRINIGIAGQNPDFTRDSNCPDPDLIIAVNKKASSRKMNEAFEEDSTRRC